MKPHADWKPTLPRLLQFSATDEELFASEVSGAELERVLGHVMCPTCSKIETRLPVDSLRVAGANQVLFFNPTEGYGLTASGDDASLSLAIKVRGPSSKKRRLRLNDDFDDPVYQLKLLRSAGRE